MKILLYTTQPQWESWDEKLAACRGAVGLARNATPTIDLAPFTGRPPVTGGKVSRSWYNSLTIAARKAGYQAVVLHFSELEAKQWGISHKLGGSCINDEAMGEMWIVADEHSVTHYKSGRMANRFVRIFAHEMSHWLAKRLSVTDQTHYWDYERESIHLALSNYHLPKTFIQNIMAAIRTERLVTPLENWSPTLVSQHFGVENGLYKSGIHAGIDFAVPVGTPLRAPTDGVVSVTWSKNKSMGNACTFEFYYLGKLYTLRCLHLNATPKKGGYRRGDVIGYTGNTGLSTGPHLHLELWRGGYDVDMLASKSSVLKTLLNPWVFFIT